MYYCPKCKDKLNLENKSYVCKNRHTYDVAKKGYVNFVSNFNKTSGDSKEMVVSRTNFLSKDYYLPLAKALTDVCNKYNHKIIVDAGCGEGYYSDYIQRKTDGIIYGFDLSKDAIINACKRNKVNQYAICSISDLPLTNGCADIVLNVFAPTFSQEYARVLNEKGILIQVSPGAKHLLGIKQMLYKDVYLNKIEHLETEEFELLEEIEVNYEIELNHNEDICALFQMTPYYWKSPKDTSDQLKKATYLKTDISFMIEVYKKKNF